MPRLQRAWLYGKAIIIRERNIILLSSIFVASLVTANLLGSKLVSIWGITVSIGVFIIPVTFVTIDLLTELYGREIATTTVIIGLAIQLYVLLLIYLGELIPCIPSRDINKAYEQMFALTPRMILASITAYTASQYVGVRIYSLCKKFTEGKYLWLRNNTAGIVSQFIDVSIFMFIFLYSVIPTIEIIKTGIAIFFVKIILTLCDTPFVYLGKYILERSIVKGKEA